MEWNDHEIFETNTHNIHVAPFLNESSSSSPGVYNVLLGCDGEIEMKPGLTEDAIGQIR